MTSCYTAYQNLIPAPLISLYDFKKQEHGVFIAPNSVELIELLGEGYYGYYDSINFDWRRLAGAEVLAIEGVDPYDYVTRVADWQSGNYLDQNIRINSVFTSYRIVNGGYSQRFGDLAGPVDVSAADLTFKIKFPNAPEPEDVVIPYYSNLIGLAYKDGASLYVNSLTQLTPLTDLSLSFSWAVNCAADRYTNGIDLKAAFARNGSEIRRERKQPVASIQDVDLSRMNAVALPDPYLPSAPTVPGTTEVIKSYVLPGNKTGVMYVSSFAGDYYAFQVGVAASLFSFYQAGVKNLLIDVSNNGGASSSRFVWPRRQSMITDARI